MKNRKLFKIFNVFMLLMSLNGFAIGEPTYISTKIAENQFTLSSAAKGSTTLFVSSEDHTGVISALKNLKSDIGKVTGREPDIKYTNKPDAKEVIIVGTIGKSPIIDQLVKSKKLDVKNVSGKWESFVIQTIESPFPGVEKALVIAGSDKRGTIYGIYDISKNIGISPWYYWADVPVAKQESLFVKNGRYVIESPKVKYRGIFLNDEAPALSGWSKEKFGGFNSKFYEKVFELLLRLKGNYLWPAMWGSAFYDDDPANGILANEMGIVMGTSHHEPMAMAQQDWHRYTSRNKLSKVWDYTKNKDILQQSWKFGIERSKNWDKIVTVGMRGDGDEAMGEGTNIGLLEQIVKDQRKIIENVTGEKAEKTPQVWALYKEVQEYYDHGMKVPDDVTLLFCDDNWGNVRKLPEVNAKSRKGGYGMYYHFDYVGGPRNSKWINISPIQRVWEQMNLSYTHGVQELWVVNVGDLKPMEYPISFFLDMAWDPSKFNTQNLLSHTENWCTQQFGEQYAKEAARIINLYAKYNRRVTPEMLDDKTYSLDNYNEFEKVTADYRNLALDALRLYYKIPADYKDAFDQLVLYPVNACSNLYEMYYAVAKNKVCAKANDIQANYWADKVEECFKRDVDLAYSYNNIIADGKWKHMMDQVHIGYTSWQEPRRAKMPEVLRVAAENQNTLIQKTFVEKDGYVSIEAENFSRTSNSSRINWEIIPFLGKTKSAITTFPQNAYPKENEDIYVEYDVDFATTGEFEVQLLFSPTLNFNSNKGLRYTIGFDKTTPQLINLNGHYKGELGRWQSEHIIKSVTKHKIETIGKHTLRFSVKEAGLVLQKILINTGGLKPSYLGAPESPIVK
ncbi:glycosyl hydrolase 115 family protein [Flavobacterium seoulense]|nr:glycosyl hydrolase 115 family protein [Flavobacterium seoulense]